MDISRPDAIRVGSAAVHAAMVGGNAAWSRPGVAWRMITTSLPNSVRSIVYGGGQFVGVCHKQSGATDNGAGVSPNGSLWSWSDVPASSLWDSIAYGGGIYVATASGSSNVQNARSMCSVDGRKWRATNIDKTIGWQSVCYGNGEFVAVASGVVAKSQDGISWSQATSMGAAAWRSVAYGGGRYVAVGSSGTNRIATSLDGIAWTTLAAPAGNQWYSVTFHDGMFVASSTTGTSRIMTSPDGTTWTLRQNSVGGASIVRAKDLYVCGSASGAITVSEDGTAWRSSQYQSTGKISRLAYGDNVCVAAMLPEVFELNGKVAVSGSAKNSHRLFLEIEESPRVVSGSSSSVVTSGDASVARYLDAQTVTDYKIRPSFLIPEISQAAVSVSVSDSGVLSSPSASGLASYVSSGAVTITASSGEQETARQIRTISWQPQSRDEFVSYIAGTAPASASSAIDNAIQQQKQRSIFNVKDHSLAAYVRNTDCWSHSLADLTCVSVWNSASGAARCGTLITPRHVLFAAHYPLSAGSYLRFVSNSNQVITRKLSATMRAPGYSPYYPDIEIGLLEEDVPPSIGFARVLPSNWRSYFTSVASGIAAVPVLSVNQNEEASVSEFYKDDGSVFCRVPEVASRRSYFSTLVSGDSGHPCLMLLDGRAAPVILTVWTYGLSGRGTSVASQSEMINSMLYSLGGGYQLTPVDLSGFPSY